MERNPDLPPEELEEGVCKVRDFSLQQEGALEHLPEPQEIRFWLESQLLIPSFEIRGWCLSFWLLGYEFNTT